MELWLPLYAVYTLRNGWGRPVASVIPDRYEGGTPQTGDIPYLYCPNCNHEEEAPPQLLDKVEFRL